MQKTKKYELNTNLIPLFSGTYNTQWEPNDYDDDGNELNLEYTQKDLMQSIADQYKTNQNDILAALKEVIPFITKIKFLNSFYSPREYNFSTDTLDFTLTINTKRLIETLNQLKDDQTFKQYLKDHYSSRDGFISFTPNNYNELRDNILNEGREEDQAIGALITYLAKKDNDDFLREIEAELWEDWNCNGYNGLNYEISEE